MPNTQQFNFTVVICAFVALIVGVSTYSLMSKPTKGDRLVASQPASPATPPMAATPAATEPPPVSEPVAAGPSPAETKPVEAVKVAKPIPRPSKRTRKARRIAKAKAEPCVGPLCVLVR